MNAITDIAPRTDPETDKAIEIFAVIAQDLLEDMDRPELWEAFPQFLAAVPKLPRQAEAALQFYARRDPAMVQAAIIVLALSAAHSGKLDEAIGFMMPLLAVNPQSPLVTGVTFFIQGLAEPENPKYQLKGKICPVPFERLEVLETSSHLCCASFLKPSIGNLHEAADWRDVWNSESAEAIRASMHDGSYRYCDKMACPAIQSNSLPPAADLAARSSGWRRIVEAGETRVERGPEEVNLAYDKTCNLSCPSCRTSKYAADEATRMQYDALQERVILPMLKDTRRVTVTGSGDPFASKNFRRMMERLTVEEYPELKFHVMTNGMLFTPREWERFPALHGRVELLSISLDGASAATHETLRRGARWEVMERNLAFAGELRRQGLIDAFHLGFVAQVENYHEMGEMITLAEKVGADGVYFGRITNWGTFSQLDYTRKAVFLPEHPEHGRFLEAMADPRLTDPRAFIGNLVDFLPGHC
ncbi:radical SAM protein [Sphingomonas sp. R-74633]|uniref:radical SAM protein n=1 Tax=Sphingomonas sp. R-74633 TaxID=2751188 RepID=UPI0015D13349|nr:radical SAM protein [Sphingomonas sp. R-74633]NYT40767.1 radical SAM protein [Sphingomonas sp. R-74633]